MIAFLALWLLLPVAIRVWSRRYKPKASWTLTGIAFGCVVSPVGFGLYATYFLGPAFIVTGFIGLLLTMIHGSPAYYLCVWFGYLEPGTVVAGAPSVVVELVNGVIWGIAYGGIGASLDWRLRRLKT